MPTGWIASQRAKTITDAVSSLCAQGRFGAARGPVEAGYQASKEHSPVVGEELRGYPNSEEAQSIVAETQKESTGCGSYTAGGVELDIKPLPLPSVGDYSFAVQLRHHRAVVDAIYVEDGSTVMSLTVGSDRSESAVLLAFAKRATSRLQQETS